MATPFPEIASLRAGSAYYLSVDIESRGNWFNNPDTAIGLYFGLRAPDAADPLAGSVKKRWALAPLPGQVDEERCVREFWVLLHGCSLVHE